MKNGNLQIPQTLLGCGFFYALFSPGQLELKCPASAGPLGFLAAELSGEESSGAEPKPWGVGSALPLFKGAMRICACATPKFSRSAGLVS
jgi:hypothetical protein